MEINKTCCYEGCEEQRYGRQKHCSKHMGVYQKECRDREGVICSVESCSEPVLYIKHGLCVKHHYRMKKTGTTDYVSTQTRVGAPLAWLENMVMTGPHTDKCIAWPFTTSAKGYGQLRAFGKKRVLAHRSSRAIFEFMDELPNTDIITRHLCNNPVCVNPTHLRFGTIAENAQDMAIAGSTKGEKNAQSKLNSQEVKMIIKDIRTHRKIASDYGICKSHVSAIKRRTSWSHLDLQTEMGQS